MFKHQCECGGDLYLVAFKASCYIPLSRDGFYLGDSGCDTEEEQVMCDSCGKLTVLELVEES